MSTSRSPSTCVRDLNETSSLDNDKDGLEWENDNECDCSVMESG